MDFKEAIDAMVNNIMSMVSSLIDKAPFDKTYTGVIKSVQGKNITVIVNGAEYVIKSDVIYPIKSYVMILVPRNNWDLATIVQCVKYYIGTAEPTSTLGNDGDIYLMYS